MTTKGNSICLPVLNELIKIPSTLIEILESKNYKYKSEEKHFRKRQTKRKI